MPTPDELAQANARTNQALTELARRSEARARAQRSTNQAAAQTFQAHDGRLNDHAHRLDTHDTQIAQIATGQNATDELYERLAGRLDIVATSHEIVATNVDRHTQQIDTHDTWFVALFERVGPNVLWGWVYGISAISAVIIGIYSYFWVFEKYGLEKVFKNGNTIITTIPADPGRYMLVSAAVGVALACVIGSLLSFVLISRPAAAANQNNAADANAAQGNNVPANDPVNGPGAPPAPAQGGVPAPPPPPAPAPNPAPAPAPPIVV